MMKTVHVRRPDTGNVIVYAVNQEGEGFFSRRAHESAYNQWQGTSQFRVRNMNAFLRELKKRGLLTNLDDIRWVSGWDDQHITESTARSFGLYLMRGKYIGKADDAASRWFWQSEGHEPLDYSTAGFPTKRAALDALL